MIPKNNKMVLFPRREQFDRINHFLNNIRSSQFYAKEDQKVEENTKIGNHFKFKKSKNEQIEFKIDILKDIKLNLKSLNKIKFFHVFMLNVIYSSESSFYKGLFSGVWNFGSLFSKTLKLVKEDILNSGIFPKIKFLEDNFNNDDSLYMFSIPIKDREIDWKVIDSCIKHVKLRILTLTNYEELLDLRATDTPLYP